MVVHAVDESVDATRCQGKGNCQSGTRCLTHSLWGDLSKQISDFLDGISLAGLMQKRDVRFISLKQDEIQKEHRVSL
jgi:Rrf2 family iron-sulfur cluster assembly transcriptional regulator